MAQSPVVIVTGGGFGIGAAIVSELMEQNARVVLVDLNEAPLEECQAKHGVGRVQYVVGDVSHHETNLKAVEVAVNTWGKVDAVALNAGIMAPVMRIAEVEPAAWTKIFNINVVAHISMLKAVIPELRKTKGRVAFTSSDAADKVSFPAWGAYGATKAAVNYVIKVVTLEEPDITAVGLYPGVVNTPMVQAILKGGYNNGMTQEELQRYIENITPRLVEPHQPGSVIANLVLKVTPNFKGEINFWDDKEFACYQ
ncbi:hypothetical protein A1O1_06337 [Capronia coronata CBS 617.96]|uniref:NAD(P)-binding protein n=1 Tax=Capronia coronata CBS 617.96 TaxID=1182541 RepID=W9Y0H3_9EURO|nr:uncharacterized protein A1O1_06337 [Capronia coronata CBS 617.96]EXJ85968.1 hypothetical protein A1O1_06337 [Capronia coronata CBS 617.96]